MPLSAAGFNLGTDNNPAQRVRRRTLIELSAVLGLDGLQFRG